MTFIKRLATLILTVFTMLCCGLAILVIEGAFTPERLSFLLQSIHDDKTLLILARSLIAVVLLQNFIFYKMANASASHEKIVAFDNPSGRVSVSISAIEDLVKRTVSAMQEVKDAKTSVSISPKGLHVVIRIILGAETNIPHLTSRIQDYVTQKVQDIVGLQEPTHVEVFIVKIHLAKKSKPVKEEDAENKPSQVPYHGYRG